MTAFPKERITSAEYRLLPETNLPMELIDGEIYTMPAPIDPHQGSTMGLLRTFFQIIPNGTLRVAPTDVELDEMNTIQPDIFWVAPNSQTCFLVGNKYWQGAPDFVVEVLSESTTKRDKREKYRLYEKYGTREYWLVHPIEQSIEVFVRQSEKFVRQDIYFVGDTFESPLLGKSLVVAEIFAVA